jgi:hypothetical protein
MVQAVSDNLKVYNMTAVFWWKIELIYET